MNFSFYIPIWLIYVLIPVIGFVIATFVAGSSKTDYDIITPFIFLGIILISMALDIGLFVGRLLN